MDLDVQPNFDLPSAIDDALWLMREQASRSGITLERRVDDRKEDEKYKNPGARWSRYL